MFQPLSNEAFLEVYSKYRRFLNRIYCREITNEEYITQKYPKTGRTIPLAINLSLDAGVLSIDKAYFCDVGGFRELINNLDILTTCTLSIDFVNCTGNYNLYMYDNIYRYLKATGDMTATSYCIVTKDYVEKSELLLPDEHILFTTNAGEMFINVDDYLIDINKIAGNDIILKPKTLNLMGIVSQIGRTQYSILTKEQFPECY